jgi:hypothetical protein
MIPTRFAASAQKPLDAKLSKEMISQHGRPRITAGDRDGQTGVACTINNRAPRAGLDERAQKKGWILKSERLNLETSSSFHQYGY